MIDLEQSIKSIYNKLAAKRQPYLERARQAAKLTIPAVMPDEGFNSSNQLPTPNQSLGAKGVNSLDAKLTNALYPTDNSPWFKLGIDELILQQFSPDDQERFNQLLGRIENEMLELAAQKGIRVAIHEAHKHLLICGNILLYAPDEGGIKIFRLDEYVVRRDRMGNVLEIIIRESMSPIALPDDINIEVEEDKEYVELYTRIVRKNGKPDYWEVTQEVDEVLYPPATGTYPLDSCPWVPIRWTAAPGEDYGRGLIEELMGDLESYDTLRYRIKQFAAMASRFVGVVDPASGIDVDDLNEAEDGEFVEGRADGIQFLQANKAQDFNVVYQTYQDLKQDLSQAFLMYTSIQRNQERVTATEIRAMIQELEAGHAEKYALLAQEMQLPLAKRLLAQVIKKNGYFEGKPDAIKVTVTTGLESLSRSTELNKLNLLLQMGQMIPGILERLKVDAILKRIGDAANISNINGLIMTDEEYQQKQQQMQQEALLQQMLPNLINQLGAQAPQQ